MSRSKGDVDRGEIAEELLDAVDTLVYASNLLARRGKTHHAERAWDLALLVSQLTKEIQAGAIKTHHAERASDLALLVSQLTKEIQAGAMRS